MAKKSFCSEVKQSLIKNEPRKKCCTVTLTDTERILSEDGGSELKEAFERIRCDGCLKEFLKAAFIALGSVSNPEKEYHLEFAVKNESDFDTLALALEKSGFTPGKSCRRGKFLLYFKSNEAISDLLAFIGANKAAFDVMNTKIVKEIRNSANRLVNCDTANIEKAISASHKYIAAIELLAEHGVLTALPQELRETAELRIQFSQASLSELAAKSNPPITKSGMKHRLEKLLKAAEEVQDCNLK